VPLHNTTATATAVRMPRVGRLAAIVVAAAGAVTIAVTADRPAPQGRTIEAVQPAASRYFDIEANKAASMRPLGRQIAAQHTGHTSRYLDIEANKARSQGAR
jgi:hypothetical protein